MATCKGEEEKPNQMLQQPLHTVQWLAVAEAIAVPPKLASWAPLSSDRFCMYTGMVESGLYMTPTLYVSPNFAVNVIHTYGHHLGRISLSILFFRFFFPVFCH